MPFLLTAALIGAGATAVNMFIASRAAKNGGAEPALFGVPVRSIGLAAGLLAPIVFGGPLAWLALAFGLGSAWPLISPWKPQVPAGTPPQLQGNAPPPRY